MTRRAGKEQADRNKPAAAEEHSPADERPPAPAAGPGVTPSMAQFLEIKAANPDCLLWYRMGDFYELFFEDAVAASQALGIVLTKRGKHLGQDIPMCGVPIHRADEYLQRLIRQGFRVAVCEQLEDPAEARKRGSKAVVHRDVVRLVTPGTLTEDSLLDAKAHNYLAALSVAAQRAVLAAVDISTGEFEIAEVPVADLPGELIRLAPSEVIASDTVLADTTVVAWIKAAGAALTPVPAATFDRLAGERQLKEQLGVADLAAFGSFSRPELAAVGALLKYVDLTQIGHRPMLRPPHRSGPAGLMVIDAASRASLELVRTASGDRQSSLLAAIDRTVTGPGSRELAARISSPLRDVAAISARLDAVGFLVERETVREDIRRALRGAPDVARAVSRLALQRGGPADLGAIRNGIGAARATARLLSDAGGAMGLAGELSLIAHGLTSVPPRLHDTLAAALIDGPPILRRAGDFVRAGYRPDLDEARALADDSRKIMADLEGRYLAQTGIKSLKVRHNNILGFYIEVTAGTAKPLLSPPHSDVFRHRQTMATAVRFTTEELIETESRIATASDRALAIEQDVFAELAAAVAAAAQPLAAMAAALADLDCVAGLAEVAAVERYVRPQLDDGPAFDIRGGRHPVVEQALRAARAGPFIDNDCVLGSAPQETPSGFDEADDIRIWLVTGPNMAGKSTFLRQNALIAVLAQMGSFVPAQSARIGVVDRLFSRVGASDDLARGRSTFMVEMVETAAILNQATERSLVIVDEIGRGTATFDGLSIAWATVEYLHETSRCRALFATHYHELTALAGRLGRIANVTMDVKEWRDEIVFLHKVKPGAADRSYGIQVAKLAGLPKSVTTRAGKVLQLLEKSQSRPDRGELVDELPLFRAADAAPAPAASPVLEALAGIDPDRLTPKEALDAIYRLKDLSAKEQGPGKA